jgi:polysaccharide export outer membrane protein
MIDLETVRPVLSPERRRKANASLAVLLLALAGALWITVGKPGATPEPKQITVPVKEADIRSTGSFEADIRFTEVRRPASPAPARRGPKTLRAAAGELADPARAAAPLRGQSHAGPTGNTIRRCQALGPAAPYNIRAIDSLCCPGHSSKAWERARIINWQAYAQGEYVGHERLPHVDEYRLRVDDSLDLVYRLTREETPDPYQLNVGDEIRVESFTDPALNRDLLIQPDGTITLRLLGQVHATGRTVQQLREQIEELYSKYYKVPAITVSPLLVNSKLEDLRASVDSRYGTGGQNRLAVVTPEGTISLPVLGSVPAQGLTLTELQHELNERYRQAGFEGIEVIPSLIERAPRYMYVLGEVAEPGRFEMTGPTTLLQALAMAGSWNVGAHLKQVVIFRRGDDWRLMATMVDVHKALFGDDPCPWGEIWLSDSDVIIVPKSPILAADDFIDLVFTRGIYGVFPLSSQISFSKLSTL